MEIKEPNVLVLSGDLRKNFRVFSEETKNYFYATKSINKPNNIQVEMLKDLMGLHALNLYNKLKNIDEQFETVDYVLDTLHEYCSTKKNDLNQMFLFFNRKQKMNEPFLQFYHELKSLVKTCNFDNQEDKILRAQLVVGIRNKKIQRKILEEDMSISSIISYFTKDLPVSSRQIKDLKIDANDEVETNDKVLIPKEEVEEIELDVIDNTNCSMCKYHDSDCSVKGIKCDSCKTPNRYVQTENNLVAECLCIEIKEENDSSDEEPDPATHFLSMEIYSDEEKPQTKKQKKPERSLKCKECNEVFYRQRQFARHKLTHTGQYPLVCEYCSKGFVDRGDLNKHIMYHIGEKKFECNICKKKFYKNYHLQNHMRIHTGERPFVCEVCAKAFTSNCSLYMHKIRHTGEKPHECDVCRKRFARLGDFKTHRRIHTGERPYACSICARRFNENAQLRKHLTTHRKK